MCTMTKGCAIFEFVAVPCGIIGGCIFYFKNLTIFVLFFSINYMKDFCESRI